LHIATLLMAGAFIFSGTVLDAGPITDTPTLRVSAIVAPPLIVRETEDGTLTGTAVNAVRSLTAKCGTNVDFIISPSWNRAYMMAQVGIVDAVIPTNFAESRLAYFDFPVSPLVDLIPSLIVRKDSPIDHFSSLEVLRGKKVGVRTKALLEDNFDAFVRDGNATLVERSDSISLIDDLLSGRIDFIADSSAMIIYHMTESKIPQRIRILEPPLGASGQYLALSKKRSTAFAEGSMLYDCLKTAKP